MINFKKIPDQACADNKGCMGYKYPDNCPFDGKQDPKSADCQECYKDTNDAIKELDSTKED